MTYPSTGNPVTEFLINGTWTDLSSRVRQDTGINITRGRQGEQGRAAPALATCSMNNRDGVLSNRNPSSAYYGLIPRGTRVRHSAGTGDCYMRTPYDDQGVANRAETADKAVLDIVGDIEVRADIWPHTWRTGNATVGTSGSFIIASKYALTGNQRSWAFYMLPSGILVFVWSVDGTSTNRVFAFSTVAVPATSGRLSLKVTVDVNNGAGGNTVAFYTATSITGTYTQLGASVITAGVSSIFSSTAKLVTGSGDDIPGLFSGGQTFGGRYYGLRVYNGIAGTEVARFDASTRSIGDTTWSDGLGTPNTWTLVGSARVTTDRLRFWGELASTPQYWDKSGTDVYIPVEAAGMLRRLNQTGVPLRSPLYRQLTQLSGVCGYWPFEDGTNATTGASAYSGANATRNSAVSFNQDTTLVGSATACEFTSTSAYIIATPTRVTATGTLSFLVYLKLPALPASTKTLFTLFTTGSARRIEVAMDAANWTFTFYDSGGGVLSTVATAVAIANQWIGFNILLTTSGANVNWSARWLIMGASGFTGIGPTAYAGSVGRFTQVNIKAGGETNFNGANFAHLLLSTSDINFVSSTVYGATNAYNGETAATRLARLAAEEAVSIQIDGFYTQSAVMSYQTIDTFINLAYACADADMGLLCEARDNLALSYRTGQDLELHRDTTLTLSSAHLAEVPIPIEDDQSIANDVTVTRPSGSSARYVKSTGTLSTATPPSGAGTYARGYSLSLGTDSAALNAAGWLAHMGTSDDARFPTIVVAMHRTQITASATLPDLTRALDAGDTVTLAGMPTWLPPDSVPLLIQGYTEQLQKFLWTVTYNTTPAAPYNTARYDYTDAAGTPRYDTSGSTLNTGITTTGTTVLLAYSTTGDNWTTTAGSYPFDIVIGGEVITLNTAPAGSTSPQTFNGVTRSVNGVVKAHLAGETAKLAVTRYYAR